MSKIGKNPVAIPEDVQVDLNNNVVTVTGPKGSLERTFLNNAKIEIQDKELVVDKKDSSKFSKSYHGTARQLLNNMVEGVTKGYEKRLQLVGIGYKAVLQGESLRLALGYSHPIDIAPEEGIKFSIDGDIVVVTGIDKEKVGRVAATIKSKRKPNVYKGKGVRYEGEFIRTKAGKKD